MLVLLVRGESTANRRLTAGNTPCPAANRL